MSDIALPSKPIAQHVNSDGVRDEYFLKHKGLAVWYSHRWWLDRKDPYIRQVIMNAALAGLSIAASKYDQSIKKTPFKTFALFIMRAQIIQEMRREGYDNRGVRKDVNISSYDQNGEYVSISDSIPDLREKKSDEPKDIDLLFRIREKISDKHHEVFDMFFVDEKSTLDISKTLNLSRQRVHQVIKIIRENLLRMDCVRERMEK